MHAHSRGGPVARALLAFGFLCLLAACGGPGYGPSEARTPHPVFKIGTPYEVRGVWYTPEPDYSYDRTGMASWYGREFDGRYTANGEVYDVNDLTAAHTTLPLPCIVEVTNLSNGRSLRLRVNDRGPFADGRIIDVSRRAAQLLGFERVGTAEVRVRVLRNESIAAEEQVIRESGQNPEILAEALAYRPSQPRTMVARAEPAPMMSYPQTLTPRPQGRLYVEAGTFYEKQYARRVGSAVSPLGSVAIVTISDRGTPFYRVQLGPFASDREAEEMRARLRDGGYREARVIDN
jgi:rare lipoprotein A